MISYTRIKILITILVFSITAIILYVLTNASDAIIANKKSMVLNEAKAHFNNMIILRLWNSSHGGIYLKLHDGLKPNEYLPENTMKSETGETYVKVNPAWMTRQVSEITNARSKYYFKITSLNPINPDNKADSFETKGLKYFEKNKDKDYYYKFSEDSKNFDFIGKLVIEPECLQCHAHQNYKVGDIRGGIRVSVPVGDVTSSIIQIKDESFYFSVFIIVLSIVIWVILLYLSKKIFKQQKELQKINHSLKEEVKQEIEKNIKHQLQINNEAKLVAMGEMVGNIAHQWRQPLSVISTGATGLKLQKEFGQLTDELFDEVLTSINDNAQYLSQTIDDFKNFIRGDKKYIEFDLKDKIESFIKIVEGSIKSHQIELLLDIDKSIIINGYPNELIQCFINIFNNTKDEFEKNEIEDKFIFITISSTQNSVVIEFKDNAGGISEVYIEKVFEPYFTTKEDSNGTGLGLHMTKEIITKMDGSIEVENEEYNYNDKNYKGAKFIITLPI